MKVKYTLNPIENLWKHIRETGEFKNKTFQNMDELEEHLAKQLKNLDTKTIQSICGFS